MQRCRDRGFTQVELIVTIVLIGIVSAIAIPRINGSGVEGRTFANSTKAALRYAQKTAIASRRLVCAAFTDSTLQISIASSSGTTSCNTALAGPDGRSPFLLDAGTGNYRGATGFVTGQYPTSLNFDARGRPLDASGNSRTSAATIAVIDGGQITVEAETGYVH